jgi:hypothetical protein
VAALDLPVGVNGESKEGVRDKARLKVPLLYNICIPVFNVQDRIMRIIVGNLPEDVTEDGIREALSDVAPVSSVKLVPEGGAPSAMIEMEMTRAEAEALARRIQGRIYEGRELRAWVPLFDWK